MFIVALESEDFTSKTTSPARSPDPNSAISPSVFTLFTSKRASGLAVPTPTFPLESILIASAPPLLNAIVSAAGK